MPLLECSRCGAKTVAKSIEEGRDRLDHAVGKTRGKPCGKGFAELVLDGVYERNITKKTEEPKKSKTQSTKESKNTFKD